MKLAEALILRADCQKRIEQLKERVLVNSKTQEGEQPVEDPNQLILEIEKAAQQLKDLIIQINKTNSLTIFQDNITLADALAQRDSLMLRRNIYRDVANNASIRNDRYSRSEVKFLSTVNVSQIQKQCDDLSQQYRSLDANIQAANWNTELLT